MSDDIKKLLSIMNETTTSGAIAPGATGMSMQKRSDESIFAAESVPQGADTGLEESPKVDSPSNFGLWKNSAVIATEQYGKHGRKKAKVDKTTIYPQLAEAVEPEQSVIDNTRRSRLGSERNAGLNEPDELPSSNKEVDFGTWHFKDKSGNVVKKDGKPLLVTSERDAKDIVGIASKAGHTIEIVGGAPELSEAKPVKFGGHSMNKFDDLVTIGKSKNDKPKFSQSELQALGKRLHGEKKPTMVRDRKTGKMYDPNVEFDKKMNSPEVMAQMKRMATKEGVAEGKEDKIAQLKKDYDTAVHWSKNEKSPQKREAARQKAEKIKRHLDTQYKTKLDEYSEWDGTGDQDLAAATAANGQEAGFADIEDKTSLSEAEITEEMIADRLKNELALFKKGSKPKDKTIGKKPADKEVQVKEVSDKKLDNYMAGVSADSQKHPADPTKRDPKKANKSVAGFSKAFNRRQKSDDQKKSEGKK